MYYYDYAEELREVLERLFKEQAIDYIEDNNTHKGLVTIGMCALMRLNDTNNTTPLLTFSCLLTRLHSLKLYGLLFGSKKVNKKISSIYFYFLNEFLFT